MMILIFHAAFAVVMKEMIGFYKNILDGEIEERRKRKAKCVFKKRKKKQS